ncbi:nuclease-related domain-containing DEAD/DEAH box helicase [Kribbia dieselivorans]|uniref:nuclease-related domain-containing DEAD/DEAH box helicase n=1 Tax=Kribbia dieselivorans TaxID=331526 RepID=UPI0008397FE3|nr:NERD domain-containing protein/DEAD/DEAH box helicase [Kribbia dieselivorans]
MSPAQTIQDDPTFVTTSERDVFHRVVKQLPPDSVVLANIRVADEQGDHEADLVVLMPGSGIVVVEVKGSHVWVENGQWYIQRGTQADRIHPVDQARNAQYALRHYVESDPRWGSRTRVRWSHHVVLARTDLSADFSLPDVPRWQVSGRGDLAELGQRIDDTTGRRQNDARPPDDEDVHVILDILEGRFPPLRDAIALAAEREAEAARLTAEQATLLKVTRLLNRVEIRGGAGSGKTVLAIQQAKDLASGRLLGQKKRVAVVCYSYGLATYLKQALDGGPSGQRPVFVGTFEDLGRSWGLTDFGTRQDSEFWEVELPHRMADLANRLGHKQKFDAIIVDEAQDFADDWWLPLVKSLRDEEEGGIYSYSDERQRVFARFGRPPVQLVPLVLDHNLRNTKQIAETFVALAPTGMELRGGNGPEVTFVEASLSEAVEMADEQVDALLDEGWAPRDIALITLGSRHPVQFERQESLGQQGYWAGFWDEDDIFYGHVLGFKGMERRAVVLCVNEDGTRDRASERLYVGLSRATDRLVVVGDPEALRRMGGSDTCRRLGI